MGEREKMNSKLQEVLKEIAEEYPEYRCVSIDECLRGRMYREENHKVLGIYCYLDNPTTIKLIQSAGTTDIINMHWELPVIKKFEHDYKLEVANEEESKLVQDIAFDYGLGWSPAYIKEHRHTREPFLYIEYDINEISYDTEKYRLEFTNEHQLIKITAKDFVEKYGNDEQKQRYKEMCKPEWESDVVSMYALYNIIIECKDMESKNKLLSKLQAQQFIYDIIAKTQYEIEPDWVVDWDNNKQKKCSLFRHGNEIHIWHTYDVHKTDSRLYMSKKVAKRIIRENLITKEMWLKAFGG